MIAMPKLNNSHNKQQGFVSLVVALTLVIILALITTGFAQLSRREQKQALDKHLSIQAYNAAESGINDAIKALPAILTDPSAIDPNKCQKPPVIPGSPIINAATNVEYTCVLINPAPADIVYKNVGAGESRNTTFSTTGKTGLLDNMTITWKSADGRKKFPADYTGTGFKSLTAWTTADYSAVLQFGFTPLPPSFSRDNLIDNLFTTYLYPATGGTNNPVVYGTNTSQKGKVAEGKCTVALGCSVTITGIPSGVGTPNYTIHLLNLYDASDIRITGKDVAGDKVLFVGGQILVDSTGKAQDVLKRVQVRVPGVNNPYLPNYTVEAQNVCKRQQTDPTQATSFDGSLDPISCKLVP